MRPDLWGIVSAVRSVERTLIPARSLAGWIGGLARRRGDLLRASDREVSVVPGLAALGISAVWLSLPAERAALEALLRACLRPGHTGVLFAEAELCEPGTADAPPPARPDQEEFQPDRLLTRQAILRDLRSGESLLDTGQSAVRGVANEQLRAEYAGMLLCRRGSVTGTSRRNRVALLGRWTAFAAAYPERFLTANSEDGPLRKAAAEFLDELTGLRREPIATRLRRAAVGLESAGGPAELADALLWLRQAVCLGLELPGAVSAALMTPPGVDLDGVQLQELIYLARAGTRDLKVLAAESLRHAGASPVARATLRQMSYDPDPWVRSAARLLPD